MSPGRRRGWWALAFLGLNVLGPALTWPVSTLGGPVWHHHASLALVLVLTGFLWRRLARSRPFISLAIFGATVLAVISGFLILYAKPWLKAEELVDWAKWWHVLWSWAALVLFLAHVWINRATVMHFVRRLHAWPAFAVPAYAVLLVTLAAIPLTWNPVVQNWISDATYIPLTLYTWIVFTTPVYAGWGLQRIALLRGPGFLWLTRPFTRPGLDLALIPATILANVSGFPILYFKGQVHENGYKFIAKYWHTWPSIAMAILVFAHTVQLWRPIRSYWGRNRLTP